MAFADWIIGICYPLYAPVGQTRRTYVHRFFMESSVEEKILEMQELKRRSHEEAVQRNLQSRQLEMSEHQAAEVQRLQEQSQVHHSDTSSLSSPPSVQQAAVQPQIPPEMHAQLYQHQTTHCQIQVRIQQIQQLLKQHEPKKRKRGDDSHHPKKKAKTSSSSSSSNGALDGAVSDF